MHAISPAWGLACAQVQALAQELDLDRTQIIAWMKDFSTKGDSR
jgi:hypothetical protein